MGDFVTSAASDIADTLRLPLVINAPSSIEIFEIYSDLRFVKNDNSCTCCGIFCLLESAFINYLVNWNRTLQTTRMLNHIKNLHERLILVNSFWGFEKPTLLPPNIRMTGPLVKRDYDHAMSFMDKHYKEMLRWLDEALKEN